MYSPMSARNPIDGLVMKNQDPSSQTQQKMKDQMQDKFKVTYKGKYDSSQLTTTMREHESL